MTEQQPSTSPILEVTCPRCYRRTDRIQSFKVPTVIFVIFWIAWTHERVTGCPRCLQARLWKLFWFSLPAANILFPISGSMIYYHIYLSRCTNRRGIPAEYAELANLTPPPPAFQPTPKLGKVTRVFLVLAVIVAALAGVFVLLPWLMS